MVMEISLQRRSVRALLVAPAAVALPPLALPLFLLRPWVRDSRVWCWLAAVFSPWRGADGRKSPDLRPIDVQGRAGPRASTAVSFGHTTEYRDRALGKGIRVPVTATSNEVHRQCADSEA